MNIYGRQQMINPKLKMIMEHWKIKIKKVNTLGWLKGCVLFLQYLSQDHL